MSEKLPMPKNVQAFVDKYGGIGSKEQDAAFWKEFRKAANAYANVQVTRICDLEHALAEEIKHRDKIEDKMRVELGGHPDSKLWGEAGLIAATMRCVDALGEVTDQRDRLAEALRECREDSVELLGERDWWQNETRLDYQKRYRDTRDNIDRADDALQSLTPNETLSNQ